MHALALLGIGGALVGYYALRKSSPSSGAAPGARPTFRAALIARALEDVGRVVETSANSGPVVDRYLALCRQRPGIEWNAAALAAWIVDACARSGRAQFLDTYNAATPEGMQLELGHAAGKGGPAFLWGIPSELNPQQCPLGAVAFWKGRPDATGVIVRWIDPATFECVQGDSGPAQNAVALMRHRVDESNLLGAFR